MFVTWQTENRGSAFARAEIRAHKNGFTIGGHAAVFNQLSENLGAFREKIAPGAFSESIEKDDIRALWNHDANYLLARNQSGTLRLHEDDDGLAMEADLIDAEFERGLIKKIERGDVSGMSIGFFVPPKGDDWRVEPGEGLIRTLTKVQLFDVSPVVYPAYPQTDLQARSVIFSQKIIEFQKPAVSENAVIKKMTMRKEKLLARLWR